MRGRFLVSNKERQQQIFELSQAVKTETGLLKIEQAWTVTALRDEFHRSIQLTNAVQSLLQEAQKLEQTLKYIVSPINENKRPKVLQSLNQYQIFLTQFKKSYERYLKIQNESLSKETNSERAMPVNVQAISG